MKYLIILLLFQIYLIGNLNCTVLDNSRCVPGALKVDMCGNVCRCLGDGQLTICTKIFCPAYAKIAPSPDISKMWRTLYTISKDAGKLFKYPYNANVRTKSRPFSLLMLK